MPNEATSARGQPPNASLLPWVPARRRAVSHSPAEGPDTAGAGTAAQMKGMVGGSDERDGGRRRRGIGRWRLGRRRGGRRRIGRRRDRSAADRTRSSSPPPSWSWWSGIVVVSARSSSSSAPWSSSAARWWSCRAPWSLVSMIVVGGSVVVGAGVVGGSVVVVVVGFGGLVVGGLVGPVDVPGAKVPGCGLFCTTGVRGVGHRRGRRQGDGGGTRGHDTGQRGQRLRRHAGQGAVGVAGGHGRGVRHAGGREGEGGEDRGHEAPGAIVRGGQAWWWSAPPCRRS